MKALCCGNNIPLIVDGPDVKQGWMGKPKGMLQISCERGHIDTNSLSIHTKNEQKENYDEGKN